MIQHQPLQHSALNLIGGNEIQPPQLVKEASDPHLRIGSTRTDSNVHSSSTSYSNYIKKNSFAPDSGSLGNGSYSSGRQYNAPYQPVPRERGPNPASIRNTLLPNHSNSLPQNVGVGVGGYPQDRGIAAHGMTGSTRYTPTIRATTRRLMETGESLVGTMLHDDLGNLSIFNDDDLSMTSIDAGRERATTALLPSALVAPQQQGLRSRREEALKPFPASNTRVDESTFRGQPDFALGNKFNDYHIHGSQQVSTMTPWGEEEGLAPRESEHLDDRDTFSSSPRSQEIATADIGALSPLFPPITTKNSFFGAQEPGSASPLSVAPRKLNLFRKSNSQSSITTFDIASTNASSSSSLSEVEPVDYNGHPVLGSMQADKAREMFLNRSRSESLLQLSFSAGGNSSSADLPPWGTANIPFTNSGDSPSQQESKVRSRLPPGLTLVPSSPAIADNANLALEMAESVFASGLDNSFDSGPSNPASGRSTLGTAESPRSKYSPVMNSGKVVDTTGSRLINGMYGRR